MTKVEQQQRLDDFLNARQNMVQGSINSMMGMQLHAQDDLTVTLCFPVRLWQMNPMGSMHGGLLATAADMTMSCAAYTFSRAQHIVTSNMNIQYMRPVFEYHDMFVKAVIDHAGSRIVSVRAWGWQKDEQSLCITANGSYVIKDRIKE